MKSIYILLIFTAFFSSISFSQVVKFGFDMLLENKPNEKMPFAIQNDGQKTLVALGEVGIFPKSISKEWLFVSCTPSQIDLLNKNLKIENFYFENSVPQLLNDSTRATVHVNEVHAGTNGLSMPYTGKNVIIGIVDDGIDFKHPDFLTSNGKTRILKYWDQSGDSLGYYNVPEPFDYGFQFDSSKINQHISTYLSANPLFPNLGGESYHGTNVSGIAVGNGLANGKNKGMAPDSKVVIVRTDFSIANWTLTVADACNYIFNVADSLGLPAVVNLSLGDYFGSHDGNDPASVLIEQLLDEKGGRIVVCAAGNSGNIGKYHVGGVVDADTSFTWLTNNPSGAYGANTVFFDLWSNISDMQNVRYSFGANLASGSFSNRSSTIFRPYNASLGGVIHDTLKNTNGERLAILEIYPEIVAGAYHLQGYFSRVDSTNYNFRFSTTGSGKYDMWSGSAFGLNAFVTSIPNVTDFPSIAHYHAPDTLMSIVSSWACSEKVITVANFRNRRSGVNFLGDPWDTGVNSGVLSVNSSKGPSRLNVLKPDVAAPGDVSFTAAPLWFIADSANDFRLDVGGMHVGNGGTSMASPCVAGIAALYLEKCNLASYSDFKTDLTSTGLSDSYTGTLPNLAFGNGKVNALETLKLRNYNAQINGFHLLCGSSDDLSITSSISPDSIIWNYNNTDVKTDVLTINATGFYTAYVYDDKKCMERDTLTVGQGNALPDPIIDTIGGILTSNSAPNYQWYMNGNILNGQTLQTLIGNINQTAQYYVVITSPDGCQSVSNIYQGNASVPENTLNFKVFPNPVENSLHILSDLKINKVTIEDLNGKTIFVSKDFKGEINVSSLKSGFYFIKISSENDFFTTKFEKM
ncbi:MAG: S8 family peptidase [Flavobacteriia bacterium]|jgi:hypothetical protein